MSQFLPTFSLPLQKLLAMSCIAGGRSSRNRDSEVLYSRTSTVTRLVGMRSFCYRQVLTVKCIGSTAQETTVEMKIVRCSCCRSRYLQHLSPQTLTWILLALKAPACCSRCRRKMEVVVSLICSPWQAAQRFDCFCRMAIRLPQKGDSAPKMAWLWSHLDLDAR